MTVRELLVLMYDQGYRDGVTAYAHWKDGEQFVGTTGRQLSDVLDNPAKDHYYDPYGALDVDVWKRID